jgi:hypothetical protein
MNRRMLVCVMLVPSCTSSSPASPTSDAATSTGSTTTGSTGSSTTTGGVSPSAHAALSVYFAGVANPTPGVACPVSPHWMNVPHAAAGGQHTSATTKGDIAVDGEAQMAIECTVKDIGDRFQVHAILSSPASDRLDGAPSLPTVVTINTFIPADQSIQGSIILKDDKTLAPYVSTNADGTPDLTCTFSVHPLSPGDQLAIAPGRIWASVQCPTVRDPGSPNVNEVCSVAAGFFVLENCSQ